ncbi:MAG: type II toxin-antitoxin system HicB family antitoxin [Rhodospirillaceae bacterium]|nr:type II toxin-antitoxin system HicB family antitoxin [Rhodospirillaceae bacterium]
MARTTTLAYPVTLDDGNGGGFLVTFPDVPEALTEGATMQDALAEAEDCLITALGGYVEARRKIPVPSPAKGRPLVSLPALVAAKVALYSTMREQGIGNAALARKLDTVEGSIRRLLDLDHRSHIGQVEAALHALGQRLVVAAQAA